MAYGTQKNTNNNLKAFAFKILTKDLPAPVFEVKERNADGKFETVKTETPVTNVRGNLIAVDVQSFDYKGDAIKSVRLTLQDDKEIDFVTIPTTFLGRSICNSLLNLQAYENVSISLYSSKPKKEGDKVYASASIRQNDEIVRWKFGQSEVPAAKVVGELKGKKVIDWSPVDDFFLTAIAALGEKVKNQSPIQPPPTEKHETDAKGGDEDVPF